MEIKLQCPIKQGLKVKKWYAQNTELKSLEDFKLCISQNFGENQRDYASLGLIGHNGLDIAFDRGTEVFASHDGIAYYSEDYMKGLGVTVISKELGIKTIYWHFLDAVMPLGSSWPVKKGDLLGHGDSTGFSTGDHCHYGLKLLDELGNVLNRDNGYDGCVSPEPYLIWWNTMNDVEVRKLYRLAFYREPDATELAFWVGRNLAEFLTVALKDRAEFLSSPL